MVPAQWLAFNWPYSLSDTVILTDTDVHTGTGSTYVLVKDIIVPVGCKGSFRIKYQHKCASASWTTSTRVYLNDVMDTQSNTQSTIYVDVTVDLTGVKAGDHIKLKARCDNTLIDWFTTNFYICGTVGTYTYSPPTWV